MPSTDAMTTGRGATEHASTTEPRGASEDEPLLGRAGEVSQRADTPPPLCSLVTGTAPLAQAGAVVLLALVWTGVLTHPIILFSAHPLLNAAAVLLAIEAVLVLQPTHTADQKRRGTLAHALLWAVALSCFYAALVVVLWHKYRSGLGHFESPHAILGTAIYVLLLVQAAVGITQYFFPRLYGSVENAKAIYKYHRVAGYTLLVLTLVNVVLATQTYYAGRILGIKTWATIAGSIFVFLGVAPRIKKQKVQLWSWAG